LDAFAIHSIESETWMSRRIKKIKIRARILKNSQELLKIILKMQGALLYEGSGHFKFHLRGKLFVVRFS
jgi:hypothetical protein